MENLPLLDTRTKENFFEEMEQLIKESSDGTLNPKRGELLHTLMSLYAIMLSDTAGRLNRTPNNHRLAFLNLQQVPRRAARPCESIAVFEVVGGYDFPVKVPKGALIAAKTDGNPLLYRTKRAFDAISSKIQDIYWSDDKTDMVKSIFSEGEEPFLLWDSTKPMRGQHMMDFLFENVFLDVDGCHSVYLMAEITIDGRAIGSEILTDTSKFRWSIHSCPACPEDEHPTLSAPITAQIWEEGLLILSYKNFINRNPVALIRLELLDADLTNISMDSFYLYSVDEDITAEAVIVGDRELDTSNFFPFQNPMEALGECFIFCGEALLRPRAKVVVEFDLNLEETLIELPKEVETVDYKWIMKRPVPKPPPEVAMAFAQSVRCEYWNGSAYCALLTDGENGADFLVAAGHIQLKFDCPTDIAESSVGGRVGFFLRLSSGICGELYKLPRRVFTPRITQLKFSYRYNSPIFPTEITAENFGERRTLTAKEKPFCSPPKGQWLFIGFDKLPCGVRMQLFFDLQEHLLNEQTFLTAHMQGSPEKLIIDDGTIGMTRGGIVSITLPEKLEGTSLFGKTRHWICFSRERNPAACTVQKIYINAQRIENRIRHNQYFSFTSLGLDSTVRLAFGNIAQAWVSVLCAGKWVKWSPLSDGNLRDGYFSLDYSSGVLSLPSGILAQAVETLNEDFIAVTYDTCDGARGNVDAYNINRMHEEIPFISAVFNPRPTASGEDSESDENLAKRSEHRLHHGGHAVSERDFELIARDLYPQIHQAKCMAGRPVRLAILLNCEGKQSIFLRIKFGLLAEFRNISCAQTAGTTVEIIEAIPVPLVLKLQFASKWHFIGARLEQLKNQIITFLNPLSGGLHGGGWTMGEAPTYEQIKAFISMQESGLTLEEMTIMAMCGERYVALEEAVFTPFNVVGAVRIEVMIAND